MGILDYVYLLVIVLFVVLGLLNIWNFANKRRNDSISDYLEDKERRMSQFNQFKK